MCYKQKCKVVSLNLAHPVCNNANNTQYTPPDHATWAADAFFMRVLAHLRCGWK